MKRKRPLSALKRELDRVFSIWIRQRDCPEEYGPCITCERVAHWTTFHAGHFVPRQYVATRYREDNVHAQCPYCNTYRHGSLTEYTIAMIEKYGRERVDDLLQAKHKTVKMRREDYENLLAKYATS